MSKKSSKDSEDFYFNKRGLLVMTEAYHLKRGFCCGKECLHCPFEHENVPSKKKNKKVVKK